MSASSPDRSSTAALSPLILTPRGPRGGTGGLHSSFQSSVESEHERRGSLQRYLACPHRDQQWVCKCGLQPHAARSVFGAHPVGIWAEEVQGISWRFSLLRKCKLGTKWPQKYSLKTNSQTMYICLYDLFSFCMHGCFAGMDAYAPHACMPLGPRRGLQTSCLWMPGLQPRSSRGSLGP